MSQPANTVRVEEQVVIVQVSAAGPQGPAGSFASTADQISFDPCHTITETNVQDALCELADQIRFRIPVVKSSIFLEDNATATTVTQNVPAKVAGDFQAGPACFSCQYDGNRITFIQPATTRVMAVASVDVLATENNQTFLVELRKNGEPVDGARVRVRRFNAISNGSIAAMIDLEQNDFVELWITNITSGNNPTVVDATFALMN